MYSRLQCHYLTVSALNVRCYRLQYNPWLIVPGLLKYWIGNFINKWYRSKLGTVRQMSRCFDKNIRSPSSNATFDCMRTHACAASATMLDPSSLRLLDRVWCSGSGHCTRRLLCCILDRPIKHSDPQGMWEDSERLASGTGMNDMRDEEAANSRLRRRTEMARANWPLKFRGTKFNAIMLYPQNWLLLMQD